MSPDSPTASNARRAWRFMSALGCVLGASALLFGSIGSREQGSAEYRTEQAVCAVISYVERQAPNASSPEAERELRRLASDMRKTGVSCPPAD